MSFCKTRLVPFGSYDHKQLASKRLAYRPADFQAFPHNPIESRQHERNMDGNSEYPWTAGAQIIGA
jgi:hypothetical protein